MSNYKKTESGSWEHREVIKRKHGYIPRGWEVHHLNGVKDDNREANLMALPKQFHKSLHKLMKLEGWVYNREAVKHLMNKWALGKDVLGKKKSKKKRGRRRVRSQMRVIR